MKLFKFIGDALSENGVPSSKRLFAFMFVVTVCYGVIYAVHRTHSLPTYIYYGLLTMIALLAGVATVPQIIKLWRGGDGNKEGGDAKPASDKIPQSGE